MPWLLLIAALAQAADKIVRVPELPAVTAPARKGAAPAPLPASALPFAAPAASAGDKKAPQAASAQAAGMAEASASGKPDAEAKAAGFFDGGFKHVCAACAENQPGNFSAAPVAAPGAGAGELSGDVRPSKYALRLRLEPEKGTFKGKARIRARVTKPTRELVLHSLDLDYSRVLVNGRSIDPSRVKVDNFAEKITISLDEPLKRGAIDVELDYEGRMSQLMRGLFQAAGKHEGKEESWTFTHLEPTHARRVLPGFDEPRFKAKFQLTLDVPDHLTPISNTPIESMTLAGGRKAATFAETPKMSSYLLAVYAARLQPKSRKVGQTLVSVWAPADQLAQADFALDAAERALKAFEKYFGRKYALPKLDLVASPEFASGAMENYGAILFRDENILLDPNASDAARHRVAEVVTHEIAHQWFGNLVTMKGWPDLWLNEAFATWLAAKIVDQWKPEWKVWEEFGLGKRGPLMVDALPGTRAVRSRAETSAEIQALFDGITYEKGGALLRMIETWIGERAFRRGIQAYIKRYAEKNAEAGDLWRELERASGKPVKRMGDGWINQAGVPLVTVDLAGSADGRTLAISQKRLSSLAEAEDARWIVPMTIRYRLTGESRVRVHRVVLDSADAVIKLPGRGKIAWAYPNADEIGYFRLSLGRPLLDAALRERGALTPTERAGLLNHLWAVTRAGKMPVSDFLSVLSTFREDRADLILSDVAGYLKTLKEEQASTPEEKAALGRFAASYFAPHAKRLGWRPAKGESEDDAMARPAVLGALALLAPDAPEVAEITALVSAYLEDPTKVPGSVAAVALNAAARGNDPKLFEALSQRLLAPRSPQQKNLMLRALAEFSAPPLLDAYLRMTVGEEILPQDGWKPFGWLLSNPATREQSWAFVKAHWRALVDKLGPRGATRIVAAAAGLPGETARRDVQAFFSAPDREIEMARKTLEQALSAMDLGVSFRKSQQKSFADWASRR